MSIVCRSSCGQVCQMHFVGLARGTPKFDYVDGWRLFPCIFGLLSIVFLVSGPFTLLSDSRRNYE